MIYATYGFSKSFLISAERGYIYAGGNHLQDTSEYKPNVWTSKTDCPSPARDATAASTINN